jgi:hypothetical protein
MYKLTKKIDHPFFKAVDPDSLNPTFQVNLKPDPDPIRIQGFNDQKLKKKNTVENFFLLSLIKNCNLLMSKLQEKPFSPQKRTSSTFFLYVCRPFCPPGSGSGYGSRDLIESGYAAFFTQSYIVQYITRNPRYCIANI